MNFRTYRHLIYADLYRIEGRRSIFSLLRQLIAGESFKYVFWHRTCQYTRSGRLAHYMAYPFCALFLRHYKYKLGISIPLSVKIGPGFFIGHFGGIVVNGAASIGDNCNISHGVTIGQANRGPRAGTPDVRDNVYIGPGAKIIGSVVVGSGSAIGANCVVVADVPPRSVVVGIPGRVISSDLGSDGYINRIDYEKLL